MPARTRATITADESTAPSGRGYEVVRAVLLGSRRDENVLDGELAGLLAQVYADHELWGLYDRTVELLREGGFTLLGRTALEAVSDHHAELVARMGRAGRGTFAGHAIRSIVDLFAGSANLLMHLATRIGVPGYGAERDSGVRRATRHNLQLASGPAAVDIVADDYRPILETVSAADLVLIDPPWGSAYTSAGLDLTKTDPPVVRILARLAERCGPDGTLAVLKTSDVLTTDSRRVLAQQSCVLLDEVVTSGMPVGYNARYSLLRVRVAT